MHHLSVKKGARSVKQDQRRFRPELILLIEAEVNKFIKVGFIREVKYPMWISISSLQKKREDHFYDLRKVFERLRRYQLKMNPSKCAFRVTSGNVFGFIICQRGIEIEQAKIDGILRIPEPRNIHELKSLQGKVSISPKVYFKSSWSLSTIQSSDEEGCTV
ncbi:UNVERIFIED_CONTAM: hypothetical protein Slati_3789400 [Sesamum latifolium]|uniref:Reverse transcriptase n=1 Tax=Sesamum latifolium TaxID=2727402 RepID=A0AAW2U5R5_9LAMI